MFSSLSNIQNVHIFNDNIAANYYKFSVIILTYFKFSAQQKKNLDKVPCYEHLGKITYNDRKNQNRYPYQIFVYV